MKYKIRLLLVITALLMGITLMFAQPDKALLRDLAEENKKSVEALVLYPPETRLAILEATKHPEVLIKMQDMREKTTAAFRTLIEDFPRSTQEIFYDLGRYPGLSTALIQLKNDPAAQRRELEVLPEDKREETFGVITRQMPTLVQINDLNQTARKAFEKLVASYPASARKAYEQLLDLPEVIDLLNEDLRFTILVGETYEDNPAWAIQKMDSLNLAVARSHAEELDNWKTSLESDPAAEAELQSAARDYATENGYSTEDMDHDDAYYADENDVVMHHYYYNPYPYWYGYPWWEPYPRWHPYPWWWDWGCRFHPQRVVIVYLPSYHFMHWYFGHPEHHHQYNHLSTRFVDHYSGHRRSGTTISEGVRQWREENKQVVSDDFIADKNRLPERLKEFGRFEQARQDYNVKNPRKPVTQEEYLNKNPRKFPEIERSTKNAEADIQREKEIKQAKRSDWAPAKAPAKPEPAPRPKTERPTRVVTPPSTKPPKTEKPATREPAPAQRPGTQPDAAKDYHRQQWEQDKRPTETRPSTPAPAVRNTPKAAPKVAPKTEKTPARKQGKIGN